MKSGTPAGRLAGKTVLVTGGSAGIGLAVAAALAREGCRVAICGRKAATLKAAAAKIGKNVFAQVCDVTSEESVQQFFAALRRDFKKLDVLVNNAGVAHPQLTVEKLPLGVWQQVIATNLTGLFLVTQAALPLMPRGATMVNNLSIAAKRAFAGGSAYGASKSGALGFTNVLREELRERGIRVVALLPGAVATDIWNQFWPEAPREKMLSPEAVAAAVVSAVLAPPEAVVEEIAISPIAGAL